MGDAAGAGAGAQRGPFLCFRRHSAQDLVIGGTKVAGSAQRRHRLAVLQHGSILLAASDHEPALPGIRELTGRHVTAAELSAGLAETIAARFHVRWDPRPLEPGEIDRVEAVRRDKYAGTDWNRMR